MLCCTSETLNNFLKRGTSTRVEMRGVKLQLVSKEPTFVPLIFAPASPPLYFLITSIVGDENETATDEFRVKDSPKKQKKHTQVKEMEDSVTETEKLLVFASKEDSRSVEEVEEKGGKTKEEEEEPSGFINQLISNLVPAGSGKEEEEDHELEKKDHVESDGDKEDNEKEGGLINHTISNLVSPSSTPRMRESAGDDLSTSSAANGGGGMINNLISNIFHHSESRAGEEEKKHHEQEQTADTGGGRGIIDNIVSHLPTPLADAAAPEPDEASILIHSIIHD